MAHLNVSLFPLPPEGGANLNLTSAERLRKKKVADRLRENPTQVPLTSKSILHGDDPGSLESIQVSHPEYTDSLNIPPQIHSQKKVISPPEMTINERLQLMKQNIDRHIAQGIPRKRFLGFSYRNSKTAKQYLDDLNKNVSILKDFMKNRVNDFTPRNMNQSMTMIADASKYAKNLGYSLTGGTRRRRRLTRKAGARATKSHLRATRSRKRSTRGRARTRRHR
jgi:hypothetical protein